MKSTVITVILLCLIWCICVSGATSVYPNSLADWYKGSIAITSEHTNRMMQSLESYGTPSNEQSEVGITTIDGSVLDSRIIDSDGSVSDAFETLSISSPTSVGIDLDVDGIITHKIIQIRPQSRVITSSDGSQIMQVSNTDPVLQIYYGYQQSPDHPFTTLYKIGSIDSSECLSHTISFSERTINSHTVNCADIIAIMQRNDIPSIEELP